MIEIIYLILICIAAMFAVYYRERLLDAKTKAAEDDSLILMLKHLESSSYMKYNDAITECMKLKKELNALKKNIGLKESDNKIFCDQINEVRKTPPEPPPPPPGRTFGNPTGIASGVFVEVKERPKAPPPEPK